MARLILAITMVGCILPFGASTASADEIDPTTGRPLPAGGTEISTAPGYCTAVASSQAFEVIQDLDFGFTEQEGFISLAVGILQSDPGSYTLPEFVNAWIDFDGDKEFEPEEQVLDELQLATQFPGTLFFSGSFPIPQIGGDLPVYMRVTLSYGVDAGPCGFWTYGSVRDFLILGAEYTAATVVNPVPAASDVEVKVGLDSTGRMTRDIDAEYSLTRARDFPVANCRHVLTQAGAPVGAAVDGSTAEGTHHVTINRRRLDFAATPHLVQGFLDRGLATERRLPNRIILQLFRLRIVSPTPGTIWFITPAPAMPPDAFTVAVEGLTPDPTATTNFAWDLTIRFRSHGRETRARFQQTQTGGLWHPAYAATIRGGNISASVSATVEGQPIDAAIRKQDRIEIHGHNPTRDAIRARLGGLQSQVIAYLESRFRQFGNDDLPLWGEPDGWGVMQIDPPSNDAQLWDWTINVDRGLAVIAEKRAVAVGYPHRVRTGTGGYTGRVDPDATDFSAAQIHIETYSLYIGGHYYQWHPSNEWRRRGGRGPEYADGAFGIENAVAGGTPPADW